MERQTAVFKGFGARNLECLCEKNVLMECLREKERTTFHVLGINTLGMPLFQEKSAVHLHMPLQVNTAKVASFKSNGPHSKSSIFRSN